MKFEDWYNASEWREGDNPVSVASDAWDYQQVRIKEIERTLGLIASFWDDNTNDHQQSGAMYDARCIALQALENKQ